MVAETQVTAKVASGDANRDGHNRIVISAAQHDQKNSFFELPRERKGSRKVSRRTSFVSETTSYLSMINMVLQTRSVEQALPNILIRTSEKDIRPVTVLDTEIR